MSMDIGKNTEPKYEMRLANNASSIVLDVEREKYPIFTTKTEENNNKNHCSFLCIMTQYATNNNSETTVITPYATDILVDLEPTLSQPAKEKSINNNIKNTILFDSFFIKPLPLISIISRTKHRLTTKNQSLCIHLNLSYCENFIKNGIFVL